MNRVKFDDKILFNFAMAMLGITIMAITFNLLYKPNNLVISGVSGLSIVANKVSGIEPSTFIAIANLLLIILSIAALGFDSSIKTIIGSIAYSFMVYATRDISTYIDLNLNEMALILLIGGVCAGLGSGLVYKYGYSSGGSDVLTMVFSKYLKVPLGKSQLAISMIVVSAGALCFGANMIIYAIIVNYIESLLIDKIQLGITGSKIFFIGTTKPDEVREYITKKLHSGVTELDAKGGYTQKSQHILMSTISSAKYVELKEKVKKIDSKAFIVVSECYEVLGGTKK